MQRMIRSRIRGAAARLALILAANISARAADDPPSLPDPIMTPGAVDPAATCDVVCNGTTRERRHVAAAEGRGACSYNIQKAERSFYEIDHLVPLAIGGANVVANLWPQPWAEADQKDVLEVELQRRVCLGLLNEAQAQREVADD